MVEVVNGYVCFNCTDTARAQKGIDPAHPDGDPLKTDKSKKAEATHSDAESSTSVEQAARIAAALNAGIPGASSVQPVDAVAKAGAILPRFVGISHDVVV